MGKLSEKEIEKRLAYCLDGMKKGKTLDEIGKGLGITGASVSLFLDRHWKPKNK